LIDSGIISKGFEQKISEFEIAFAPIDIDRINVNSFIANIRW